MAAPRVEGARNGALTKMDEADAEHDVDEEEEDNNLEADAEEGHELEDEEEEGHELEDDEEEGNKLEDEAVEGNDLEDEEEEGNKLAEEEAQETSWMMKNKRREDESALRLLLSLCFW